MDGLSGLTTLVDLLQYRAETTPDKVAYRFLRNGQSDEVSITYAELDRRARSIAVSLRKHVEPGSRVLINHLPGLDYIASYFGCLYAATIAVPVYPPRFNQKLDRINSIVQNAEPGAALTSASVLETIQPLLSETSSLNSLLWLKTDDVSEELAESWSRPDITGETTAFLQYTSGSTSEPKGVLLSHSNLMHNLKAISEKFELVPGDSGMVWLPPYHDMGLIGGILVPAYNGFSVVLMSPYTFLQRPYRWLQALTKYRVTCTGAPNFAFDLCAERISEKHRADLDLSSVRLAFCGAEPIRAGAVDRFFDNFEPSGFSPKAFYACYGLAEASLMVSGVKAGAGATVLHVDGDELDKNGQVILKGEEGRAFVSCGTAPSGHKIEIVDPKTHEKCREGRVGEIWFSGPSVAQGYWKLPEESERIFQATIYGDPRKETYLRTGDLGFLQKGELFVTGRLKDLLIIRGRNFYPQDIEHTVEQSHDSLKPGAGAAFSVQEKDEEKLVIVQELDRGAKDVDLDAVVQAIREQVVTNHGLNPYAISLIKTNSIPVTSSGKIQRHASRKLFLTGQLNERKRFVEY